jgi:hypothetical protein
LRFGCFDRSRSCRPPSLTRFLPRTRLPRVHYRCTNNIKANALDIEPQTPEPLTLSTVTKGNGYDVRQYPDAKWTSITVRATCDCASATQPCPSQCFAAKSSSLAAKNHHDLHQVQEVSSLQTAISTGFQAIFQYISGANSLAEKIEMTAPVRVEVLAPQGPYCKANVTTSFFLPWSFQNSSAIPKATRP